ncbi:MAG: type II secretion system F family protein [Propionibacteriaceae bacterium]|jgi:Flp pilus assembly protein TadB|nr:type II secretion system F family protein [Propionibacteriaceae bacterium]
MSPELSALIAAAAFGFGLLAVVLGLVRQPEPVGRPRWSASTRRLWRRFGRRTKILLAVGLGLGLVTALISGWVVALPVIPAALVGIPWLLGPGDEPRQLERLKAMEEWTRTLAGVLVAGMSLEQAVQVSLKSTAAPVKPEISRLVGRLNARMPTPQALTGLAAELNDPTGDLIVAALCMGARRRGSGLALVLSDLAESVSAEVRARQRIDADRATHRTTARGVTLITLVMLGGLTVSGSYIAPYGTPLGQFILVLALAGYVAILVQLKHMGRTPTPPRFLQAQPIRPRETP